MSELTIQTDDEVRAQRRERERSQRREQETGEYVGFIGCAKAGVLKVRVHTHEKHVMEVACTCGEIHMTPDPMIREICAGEVVTLIEEGTPMMVGDDAPKDPGASRRQVSDAAIFDAIPADRDVTAGEIAETLGIRSDSLIKRLRRINIREDKKGASSPFILTSGGTGVPMLIRRAGP